MKFKQHFKNIPSAQHRDEPIRRDGGGRSNYSVTAMGSIGLSAQLLHPPLRVDLEEKHKLTSCCGSSGPCERNINTTSSLFNSDDECNYLGILAS